MGSIESGILETAATCFPLPSPLPQAGEGAQDRFPLPSPLPRAGEGAQDRLTISAAHI